MISPKNTPSLCIGARIPFTSEVLRVAHLAMDSLTWSLGANYVGTKKTTQWLKLGKHRPALTPMATFQAFCHYIEVQTFLSEYFRVHWLSEASSKTSYAKYSKMGVRLAHFTHNASWRVFRFRVWYCFTLDLIRFLAARRSLLVCRDLKRAKALPNLGAALAIKCWPRWKSITSPSSWCW